MSVGFLQNHFWKLLFGGVFLMLAGIFCAFYKSQIEPGYKNRAKATELVEAGFNAGLDSYGGVDWWSRFEHRFPDRWSQRLIEIDMRPGNVTNLVSLDGVHEIRFIDLLPPSDDRHFETIEAQKSLFNIGLKGEGFTDRTLLHLQAVLDGQPTKEQCLTLNSTGVSGVGLTQYLATHANWPIVWLILENEIDLKPSLCAVIDEFSLHPGWNLGLVNMDLKTEDLAHLKNRTFSWLHLQQEQINLDILPAMECHELSLRDSDCFAKSELAPLARIKIRTLSLQRNGLSGADVKFLTDKGVRIEWK